MHWLEFWGLRVNGFESADALAEALFNTAPERRPALVVLGLMPKHLDTAVITDLLRRDRGTTALLVLITAVSQPLLERDRQIVVLGTSVYVRVSLLGRRYITTNTTA